VRIRARELQHRAANTLIAIAIAIAIVCFCSQGRRARDDDLHRLHLILGFAQLALELFDVRVLVPPLAVRRPLLASRPSMVGSNSP